MYETGIFVGQQPIVLSDCRIKLAKETSSEKYPDEFRMITACVLQDGKPYLMQFLSNQFEWSACSICELYLARWGIEVFFKEIKQTLQLADFLGTSENAIKWQGPHCSRICYASMPGLADGKDCSEGSSPS